MGVHMQCRREFNHHRAWMCQQRIQTSRVVPEVKTYKRGYTPGRIQIPETLAERIDGLDFVVGQGDVLGFQVALDARGRE